MFGKALRIPKVQSRCAECKESFVEKQPIISSLEEKEEGYWLRADYCLECAEPHLLGALYWQRRYPISVEEDAETLHTIEQFVRLAEDGGQQSRKLAYTLYQFLKRLKKAYLISSSSVAEKEENLTIEAGGYVVTLYHIPKDRFLADWLCSDTFQKAAEILESHSCVQP